METSSSQQSIWTPNVVSFGQILQTRAERQPSELAFSFTPDGETVTQSLTYGALYDHARAIAARLQQHNLGGERVILCFPPGLDFVAALYGCFLARSMAVPAPYQQGRAARVRLASIIRDARPAAVLSTAAGVAGIGSRRHDADEPVVAWIAADLAELDQMPDDFRPTTSGDDPIAILQYTSGSTADPKGVVLRQSTLLANNALLAPNFLPGPDGRALCWLPTFHDFGLVTGVLQPLFTGFPIVLMSPAGFLRNPLAWLRAIWRFRATCSGGPNFAYDLCVERFRSQETGSDRQSSLAGIDLSHWRAAANGAEMVRSETLERFARTFEPFGFRSSAFSPSYGLAESTVFVAGGIAPDGPVLLHVDSGKLRERTIESVPATSAHARTFVGCRIRGDGHVIAVVDPETQQSLPERCIGEIWVSGPSVADGYWNRPDATRDTFQATLNDHPGRRFLRTGDLGFLDHGAIFVIGRNRDFVVVRGLNHFFVDLERTAAASHPEISHAGAVAFAVEADSQERLVVVTELRQAKRRRSPDLDDTAIVEAIRRSIRESHGIDPLAIALVEPMSLPRTSSGKIQRGLCKQRYLDSTLEFASRREVIATRGGGQAQVLALEGESRDVATDLPATPGFRPSSLLSPLTARTTSLPEVALAESARRPRVAPVAIVAAHGRFPGANGLDEFWQLLRDGDDAISEIPSTRWSVDDFYDVRPGTPGKIITRWGGFVGDVDRFDAQFFGTPPREAALMDPQQRLLLEVVWEALEAAGRNSRDLAGSHTGVFVGIGGFDYAQSIARHAGYDQIEAYAGTGSAHSVAANRLSYFLDLRGPSVAIDTACSSSLVAVHLACEALRRGECTSALAAGVNVIVDPTATIAFSQARMLSPEGRCKTFDADADGYVRGEGCGVVLLKLLDDALRDGDEILGVIRGSAVNQDGRTSGITAPSGLAQQAVIQAALDQAGARPSEIGFVEAHGTGTPLGDVTELRALAEVFRDEAGTGAPCVVGSVKANIGHLECASGIAGLIKALLCLRHGEVPPQIHMNRVNPEVDLGGTRLEISTERRIWKRNGRPRLAGISSFGFGGTNAHVIVEEPPNGVTAARAQSGAAVRNQPGYVLPLSARTPEALRDLADRYAERLTTADATDTANVCFTAGAGRTHFAHRLAVSAATDEQLRAGVGRFLADDLDESVLRGHQPPGSRPRIAFLFTGQGAQYTGMARGLYEHNHSFRKTLDACDAALRPLLREPLLRVLYDEKFASLVDETEFTQPALFAVEYALAQYLVSLGIRPDAVLGHSVGEFVAACLAGVFGLEDGLRLVAERARLMQSLPRDGMMAAVFADGPAVDRLVQRFNGNLAIAARNAPQNTVISGRQEAVTAAIEEARHRGWKGVPLKVSHAFHSPLMADIAEPFRATANQVSFQAPTISLVSNLTGKPWTSGSVPDADYWTRHLLEAVRFADGVRALRNTGVDVFVEVGPNPTLIALGKRCLLPGEGSWVHCLARNQDDRDALRGALAQIYCAGLDVDWATFYEGTGARRVIAPTYPFQRERHWFVAKPTEDRNAVNGAASLPPSTNGTGAPAEALLGYRDVGAAVPTYAVNLAAQNLSFLADHRVDGQPILPASAYVDLGLALAADQHVGELSLRDVHFHQLKRLDDESPSLRTVALPAPDGSLLFQVRCPGTSGNILLASGTVSKGRRHEAAQRTVSLSEIRDRCAEEIAGEQLYAELAERGLDYQGLFHSVERVWRRDGEALGQVRLGSEADLDAFQLHPALLDACFHVALGALPAAELAGSADSVLVPVGVESLIVHERPSGPVLSHVILDHELHLGNQVGCDVQLVGENGALLVELSGLQLQRLPRRSGHDPLNDVLYDVTWVPQRLPTGPEPSVAGDWIVVANAADTETASSHLVQAVADEIAQRGGTCVVTWPENAESASAAPRAVLFFASPPTDDPTDARDVRRLLALSQELLARPKGPPLRLGIVTVGSQPPTLGHAPEIAARRGLNQSLLWGFGRTLARERPNFACTLVDLSPAFAPADAARALIQEIATSSGEEQVVLRDGDRLVARLAPLALDDEAAKTNHRDVAPPRVIETALAEGRGAVRRLELNQSGSFGGGSLQAAWLPPLAPGEIEIDVVAAGVNFRDVMKSLGIYPVNPGMPSWLGDECSGVVTACGEGVTDFKPGDEVVAIAPASFSTRVHAPAHFAFRRPVGISAEEAATIPIAFSTAYFALVSAARLSRGETVLIHGGAGGVGLAAIQVAQSIGATVYATAGSPEKRDYLRSLGVADAFDSRSLDFADAVRDRTGGQGVDVVLNSLSGEALVKSFDALRPFGRFVEIGKRDIFENAKIGLRPFQRNLAFVAVDMERFFAERPDAARALLGDIADRFADGSFRPLPRTTFPIADAPGAFHYMSQRKNVGKVVLSLADLTEPSSSSPERDAYLITGGLGGLGREVAKWLVSQGARHLVLVSRHAAGPERATDLVALRERGVDVETIAADVADRRTLERILADLDRRGQRLAGVFHAAGVLDDAAIPNLDDSRLDRVLGPKVRGAWNLHELTRDRKLDQFVLFSSVASVLGSPGQANYAAANAFLDGLSHYRRQLGLPAISINWGPWSETGMTARAGANFRFAELGLRSFSNAKGVALLGRLDDANPPQAIAVAADWPRFFGGAPSAETPSLLRLLSEAAVSATNGAPDKLRPEIVAILSVPEAERPAALLHLLKEQFAAVTGLSIERLDPSQPLTSYGLDSLMGLELLLRIERRLEVKLPTEALGEDVTLAGLAAEILPTLVTSRGITQGQGLETTS
jgi:polyketide synthase 12